MKSMKTVAIANQKGGVGKTTIARELSACCALRGYQVLAVDCVLVPCAADAMGLQGLADLAYTINQIRKNVNSDLKMLGAVINLYKPQRNLSAESRSAVEAAIELVGHVFDTNIHDYSKIAEAPSQKLPAVLYAKTHR